ncbi:Fur family transcriptional regulator [Cellulomonas marina]|uniref:Fur family transcriptional regulator, ferric uptake regulator n=1 Tax=Cellulomonas marina TaxID=988821 RepID=A0A1I0ZYR1_9CELL|nr:transcriptional repressor [Cellulomonas marina]GIG30550.1 transcriptional repressor [Cellulomonas marina]SFB29580.1 Fur family transcriptional regulator, ferric uptake regulator [Cellulomonas marina]
MAVVARRTKQRAEILGLLDEVDEFRSAQQLHELLRARGSGVGLATVYRAVQTLADAGEVDVLRSADGESVYRRCERRGSHHHHLVCRVCGRTVEIDGPAAESWAESVAAAHGFAEVDHTIELVGTCAACREANHEAGLSAGPTDGTVPPVG